MQASKITVSKLNSPRLKGKRKTALRRKLVMEFIDSKPSGETITFSEFQHVGQWGTPAEARRFVENMKRDGLIAQYAGDKPRTYYYAVLAKVRTSSKPREPRNGSDTAFEAVVQDKAMRFAWAKDSDSLREFVKWINGGEK